MYQERIETLRSVALVSPHVVMACVFASAAALAANSTAQTVPSEKSGRVLRHAVFFKFNDSSSADDVQQVVDAFRALPGRIDSIDDFQWGTTIAPSSRADGFTHCFVLTFQDEEGRTDYLPHPAHKQFGRVLGPHLDKVFVIDYWGTPHADALDKELKHAVFFKFHDDAPPKDVQAVVDAFAALPGEIATIRAFEWGLNNSPETHDEGFTHAFMVSFDSEPDLADYGPHAAHQALVQILRPVLEKVRVIDFWVEE